MTERLTCGTCKFWVPKAEVPRFQHNIPDGFGECRIRAASGLSIGIMQKSGDGYVAVTYPFPPTADNDWCGEYSAATQEPQAEGETP